MSLVNVLGIFIKNEYREINKFTNEDIMNTYTKEQELVSSALQSKIANWGAINPEYAARMRMRVVGVAACRRTVTSSSLFTLHKAQLPVSRLK